MTDLISVSGICFVAVEPTTKQSDKSDRSDKSDSAKSQASPNCPCKRKYRPRGERTRKEQQRDAARNYYLIHRLEILSKRKAEKMKKKKCLA